MSAVQKRVVFLVEDNADDEALSLRGIARSGLDCIVAVARDGQEAMRHIRTPGAKIPDLVLLDYELPKADGLAVLKAIRASARTSRVPVVMFSSTNEIEVKCSCYKLGANSFIVKPLDLHSYLEQVSLVVRHWLTVNQKCARPGAIRPKPLAVSAVKREETDTVTPGRTLATQSRYPWHDVSGTANRFH